MMPGNNPDCCHVLVKVFHFLDLFVIYLCQNIMSKAKQLKPPTHYVTIYFQPLLQYLFYPPRSQLFLFKPILFKITDDLAIMPFVPLFYMLRKQWEVTWYLRSYFRNNFLEIIKKCTDWISLYGHLTDAD